MEACPFVSLLIEVFLLKKEPIITISDDKIITCIITERLIKGICNSGFMERKSKMVINPRGAIKSNGTNLILLNFNTMALTKKIPAVILTDQTKLV